MGGIWRPNTPLATSRIAAYHGQSTLFLALVERLLEPLYQVLCSGTEPRAACPRHHLLAPALKRCAAHVDDPAHAVLSRSSLAGDAVWTIARDARRAHRAVRFGNRGAPQRAGPVAPLPQRPYGHPPDGKGLAAERVGQHALQGFHLAGPASLPRLHDTYLGATHLPLDHAPVDLVPAPVVVGRTSSRILDGCRRPGRSCRHLRRVPDVLVMEDQADVCPLSRGAMSPRGSAPIRPATGRPSLPPPSAPRTPVGSLSLAEGVRAHHVPRLYLEGVGPAYPPVAPMSAAGEAKTPAPGHLPFGPSLSAPLACCT